MKVRLFLITIILFLLSGSLAFGAPGNRSAKSKFYDFSEQLINGEIKRPTVLYIDQRNRVKFNRLLRLKRSFLEDLFSTSRERVFK